MNSYSSRQNKVRVREMAQVPACMFATFESLELEQLRMALQASLDEQRKLREKLAKALESQHSVAE